MLYVIVVVSDVIGVGGGGEFGFNGVQSSDDGIEEGENLWIVCHDDGDVVNVNVYVCVCECLCMLCMCL